MSAKNAKPRKTSKLTDEAIKAQREFETYGTFYDRDVRGLRVRVGVHRSTWEYYRQYRKGGSKVKTLRHVLGHFPEMNTIAARKETEKIAGKIADGVATQGKKRRKEDDEHPHHASIVRLNDGFCVAATGITSGPSVLRRSTGDATLFP